jgi:hypothetical protein
MTSLNDIVIPPLAIVCHDAGATNIIASLVGEYNNKTQVCVKGPAIEIWNSYFPKTKALSLDDALKNANTLLSGTGMGDLEYLSRIEAKKKNIKNIAVIEHWINYLERFTRNSKVVLPDQIIVTDKYAKRQADAIFPSVSIIQMQNIYLHNEAKLASESRKMDLNYPYENILILAEPLQPKFFGSKSYLFQSSVDYLFSNLKKIDLSKNLINVCLRPHPSESAENYDFIRANYQKLVTEFSISNQKKLYEDIAWADLVLGTDSFAMAIALTAKIPTISFSAPDRPDCLLPYKEIIHLKKI